MRSGKKRAPKAAATAEGANIAGVETNEANGTYHDHRVPDNAEGVIFEFRYRGALWRFQIYRYRDRLICSFRKWLPFGDGYRPTQEGAVIPLGRLPELYDALAAFLHDHRGSHEPLTD